MKKLLGVLIVLICISCKKEIIQPKQIVKPNNVQTDTIVSTKIIYKELITSFSKWNSKGVDFCSPILIDLNGNKKYDIIVSQRKANRTGNTYTYELLNPIAIIDNESYYEINKMWKGGENVCTGDFNGDGYLDIAEFDNGHKFYDLEFTPLKTNLEVWWNSKNGFLEKPTYVDTITHNSYAMASGDLDNDGKDEIVRMDIPYYDNYFKFNGNGFDKKPILNLPNITNSGLFFIDIDGDKKTDAISAADGSPTIIWNFLNNPVKSKLQIPTGLGINNTVVADFDNDNFKDIIFICQKEGPGGKVMEMNHYFLYYKNDGKNNFELKSGILPEFIPFSQNNTPLFVAKDIDWDGDADFYNINSDYDEIFINKNGILKRYNKLGYELQ